MRVVSSCMDSSTHVLLARPGFKSPKDLKGKVLGVSSFGASAAITARSMFRQSGVDPERELKIVALGPDGARLAALQEGIVDVIVTSPPTDHQGVKMGYSMITRAHDMVKFPFTGLGTNMRKLGEKPDEVKKMIRAGIRANHYIRQNREGTIQVLMDCGETDRDSATATYDSTKSIFSDNGSMPESGLKLVIEQNKVALKIDRSVSLDEVADFGQLRVAQKDLGIRP